MRHLVVCCCTMCIIKERMALTATLPPGSFMMPSWRIVEATSGVTEFIIPTMVDIKLRDHRYDSCRTCGHVNLEPRQMHVIQRQMREVGHATPPV